MLNHIITPIENLNKTLSTLFTNTLVQGCLIKSEVINSFSKNINPRFLPFFFTVQLMRTFNHAILCHIFLNKCHHLLHMNALNKLPLSQSLSPYTQSYQIYRRISFHTYNHIKFTEGLVSQATNISPYLHTHPKS